MKISYRSDVYQAGRDEDGEAVYGEVFYVYAELSDGSRYAHHHAFQDTSWVDWDFGDYEGDFDGPAGGYKHDGGKAEAAASALAAKVEAAGDIDLAYWARLDSAYGSTAYLGDVAAMSPAQRGYAA